MSGENVVVEAHCVQDDEEPVLLHPTNNHTRLSSPSYPCDASSRRKLLLSKPTVSLERETMDSGCV